MIEKSSRSNSHLAQFLINEYVNRDAYDKKKETNISSHWDNFLKQMDVKLDDVGNLIGINGWGFGAYKIGKLELLANQATIWSCLAYLKDAEDIKKLLKKYTPLIKKMGFQMTFDSFRQLCTLNLLSKNINLLENKMNISFLMIGDGYGLLSALIKMEFPQSKLFLVDLGQVLLTQYFHINLVCPEMSHVLSDGNQSTLGDFNYCPSDQLERLNSYSFDATINICSMQEMNNFLITKYFDFMRSRMKKNNFFYCCNRLHKELPGGEVLEFEKYPWSHNDHHFIDEETPWQKYFFAPWRAKRGLKIFGCRLPFINYYDGDIHHRLTRMETQQ